MIDAYLRPLYQQCLVRPLLKWFKQTSPTTITLIACAFGVLVVPALYLGWTIVAIIFLLLSGYLDTLDNGLAQDQGALTVEVSAIDTITDRIVEFAIILGLFAADPLQRGLLTLLMLGSCYIYITCYLIVALYSPRELTKQYKYTPGIIERSEAFIFFIVMILFPHYFTLLSSLFIILVLLTSAYHLREFIVFSNQAKNI